MSTISKKRRKELEKLEAENTKYCTICKKVKPLFEFNFNSSGRKFADPYCTKCRKLKSEKTTILRTFGITLKEYDKILEKQDGGFKICGTKIPRGSGRFHIDHNHSTGKIRGLLCSSCNVGLGHFKDDIETLAKAITYLVESK